MCVRARARCVSEAAAAAAGSGEATEGEATEGAGEGMPDFEAGLRVECAANARGCRKVASVALVVGQEGVGTMFEKEIDDIIVASFCGPQDGRCNCVAALCIYVCAALYEKVT